MTQLVAAVATDGAREEGGGAGSARRRREPRLRTFLRQDRMVIARALADILSQSTTRAYEKKIEVGRGVRRSHGDRTRPGRRRQYKPYDVPR